MNKRDQYSQKLQYRWNPVFLILFKKKLNFVFKSKFYK